MAQKSAFHDQSSSDMTWRLSLICFSELLGHPVLQSGLVGVSLCSTLDLFQHGLAASC